MSTDNAVVRVSSLKRKYTYVDYAKYRLNEGFAEVTVSALGSAISDAVSVVELLKSQGMVVVKKIRTDRAKFSDSRAVHTDKIEIIVVKSPDFDVLFAEQQRQREEAKANAAAAAAEGGEAAEGEGAEGDDYEN